MNASKDQAQNLQISFGIMRVMMTYLEPLAQVELQQANRYFYEIAVSRVATRFILGEALIFHNDAVGQHIAYLFDPVNFQFAKRFDLTNISSNMINDLSFIKVRNDLFVYE